MYAFFRDKSLTETHLTWCGLTTPISPKRMRYKKDNLKLNKRTNHCAKS